MGLSYPGVKLISPALTGRFFTSEPPRQPLPSLCHYKTLRQIEVSRAELQVQAANCISKDLHYLLPVPGWKQLRCEKAVSCCHGVLQMMKIIGLWWFVEHITWQDYKYTIHRENSKHIIIFKRIRKNVQKTVSVPRWDWKIWKILIFWYLISLGCYKEWQLERRYPTSKVRSGGWEEIPNVQSKEQWLCFAGAAVKRYPKFKVRETPVRE